MFHRFPDELGMPAQLVSSTDLTYSTDGAGDPALPNYSMLTEFAEAGYVRHADGSYQRAQSPPLRFGYSSVTVRGTMATADPDTLQNLALEGGSFRFVDLDGDGVPGILTEDTEAWFYRRNLGPLAAAGHASFEPVRTVTSKPATATASTQLLDLRGDGRLCAVDLAPPAAGYYAREGTEWVPYREIAHVVVHRLERRQPTHGRPRRRRAQRRPGSW